MSHEQLAARQQISIDVARAGDVFSEISDRELSCPRDLLFAKFFFSRCEALQDGLVRIVRTFGDKLAAFKFPPRTAKKLQGFVDYN